MNNSKNRGWVRLHRKIDENELWFLEPFTKAQAWIDLFLNANHKDGLISIRGNVIDIKRCQIGWSELTMAKRWTWSKNKVRRFLKLLETKQQIEQQKSPLTTIITILNYEEYQKDDTTDDTTERQQKDSRRYTNKNDKNVNNDNKKRETSRFTPPPLSDIESYISEKNFKVDSNNFMDFYASKGWMVGKNKMKDWKASVRTWARRDNTSSPAEQDLDNYIKQANQK